MGGCAGTGVRDTEILAALAGVEPGAAVFTR